MESPPSVPWYPPSVEPEICFTVYPPPSFSKSSLPEKTPKDRIADWFIHPLNAFSGEDSVISLMVCCALLEAIVRFELKKKNLPHDIDFTDGSDPMKELQQFLDLPNAYVTEAFWRTARNGLLHRAMPQNPATRKDGKYRDIAQRLSPEKAGTLAKLESNTLTIHIWELRDKVVQYLRNHGEELWNNNDNPLMEIVTGH